MLADIAELTGQTSAIALARVYGGRRVYVPEAIDEGHALAVALGLGPARALSEMYAGETLEVPFGPYSDQGGKRRAIITLLLDGNHSIDEMAHAVGCTRRWVLEVKASLRPETDSNQLGLFSDDEKAA